MMMILTLVFDNIFGDGSEVCQVGHVLRCYLVGHLKRREGVRWESDRHDQDEDVFPVWPRVMTDQDRRSHEEVIEGVVQQVHAGGGVKICITHQLAGEQRLSGAAAQEAAHLAVGQVHSVGQHLHNADTTTSRANPGECN